METQVTAAAVVSFLIAFLKKQSWFPWISTETEKINRVAAIVLSGLASLGIHAHFSHESGILTVTGLTLTTVAVGLWHWVTQFALTHGWFKATSASDQIYALLKTIVQNQLAAKQAPAVVLVEPPATPVKA